MATFDLNDDSVVCIVGSGAGGGTLGNELAQKGIKVVILEAGGRHEIPDFVNDEWASFTQLAWKDMRTTSGTWRVAHDFPNLPAWIVKSVGGSTVHWAGASLRFQEHEFKARSTYGNIAGANLLDWPITLAEMEPWYAKAEDKMGTTGTNDIPRLPGNNNFKVLEAGARKLGYKEVHTGNMSINSQPRDGRGACQQIGFCFQGCKSGGKWSTLYTEIPKGEATGNLEVRPNAMALHIEHDAQGKVTGVVYVDADGKQQRQKARVVAVAGNSLESPRLLLNSAVGQVPARSGEQLGAGGPQLHASHHRQRLRGVRQAGAHVSRHHHGRHRARRGAQRSEARLRRWLRAGDAVARPAVHGGVPQSGRLGPQLHQRHRRLPQHGGLWIVGEDMPREQNRVTLDPKVKDANGMPVASVHFDDHENDEKMRNHAYRQGAAIYEAVGAVRTFPTPPYPSTHNLGTNRMSANARDGVVNKWGQTHDIKNLFVSDGSQFTTGAACNPTLTIVALAIRQADAMAGMMGRKEI